ncbi:hypothetical protein GCM10011519_17410 [Marmoricola endophyticus]|uniref:Beta-lactamase-related domain-containing protein n=1 Tax=Marmoricola endophyticus TaxID=2040280 RepID=A0A917BH47_9ACTN|nr:serine hydrolase domain-containing protein [Marmoricola endophyticus]GGF44101.1 hypothetical protein GCM10011519_17410 [Marmoricola endophyticus]
MTEPSGPESRLAGLQMVNPHLAEGSGSLGRTYVDVPGSGEPLPSDPGPLGVAIDGAGRRHDLAGWLAATYATSLVVVRGGTVVHEWYADGLGPGDLFLGASMTKSALAHLVGDAVAAGDLSLDDPVVDLVPELAGSGWATCTVADVASMTSGVDWVEDHRDPDGPASRLVGAFAGSGGSSRALLTRVGPAEPPGTRFEYCTADSQVLDWVRERATGRTYVEATAAMWRTLGCEHGAVVGTDDEGVAMAGGALAATARDWARVGLHQLAGGEWVELSSRPAYPWLRPGRLPSSISALLGFGMHWWPLDDAGRQVTADGSRGQFCFVDRDREVVVVKTSQWPYADPWADRQYRDLSILGLAAIADADTGTTTSSTTIDREEPS